MEKAPFHADLAEAPSGENAFWLTTADGKRLRAVVWAGGDRGTVLLFNGRTEYAEKYGRVIARLSSMGFAVATLDWRGQGLSARPSAGTGLGHVDDFTEYQRDVDAFLAAEPVRKLPGPRVLLCHSMGGCIGMRALADGRAAPDAAVFSAPMLGLMLSPAMRPFARMISFFGARFGLSKRHAPFGVGDDFYVLTETFEKNLLTTDPEHWSWFGDHLRAHPELGLGAPSLGWLDAAFRETAALATTPSPPTPALFLLGEDEQIVCPDAIRARAAGSPAVELSEVAGGRHEMLMEDFGGALGVRVWSDIERFLAARGL